MVPAVRGRCPDVTEMRHGEDVTGYGIAVRAARRGRTWTQRQLADAMGVNERTVSRVEAGDRPSPETAMAVAAVLGVEAPPSADPGAPVPVMPAPADAAHARLLATLVRAALADGDQVLLAPDVRAFEAHGPEPVPGVPDGVTRPEAKRDLQGTVGLATLVIGVLGFWATVAALMALHLTGHDGFGSSVPAGSAHHGLGWLDLVLASLAIAPLAVVTVAARDLALLIPAVGSAARSLAAMDASDGLRSTLFGVGDAEVSVYTVRDAEVSVTRHAMRAVESVDVADGGAGCTVTLGFEGGATVAMRCLRPSPELDAALTRIEVARADLPYRVAA